MSDFEKGAVRLLSLMAVAYDAEHVGECSADDLSMDCPACDAGAALWTAFRSLVFGSSEPRSRSVPTAVEALRALPLPAPPAGESREASAMREVLRKYGVHHDACASLQYVHETNDVSGLPCDCGLDAALTKGIS